MPVTMIKGPTGLTKEEKRQLIEGALHAVVKAYRMPDDRVYLQEVPSENVGHTPLLQVTNGEGSGAYRLSNGRDVLVSIDQHTVEDFASNGFLQTENPDMASFAASLRRG